MSEYFFELLTEEIPAWMLEPKIAQIGEQLTALWTDIAGSEPESSLISVGATPRRIHFNISGLPEKQADREEEVRGPAAKIAFTDGAPAPALLGFLKKNGASPDDVTTRDDYVWIVRKVSGTSSRDLLAARIPKMIEGLRWPKTMRWGRGEHAYIRPVHSVISLFDGEELPLTIFGVMSGRTTRGHRILANDEIAVTSREDYRERLADHHVIAGQDDRAAILRTRAEQLAAEVGGTPADDRTIWEQWKFLTEYPGLIRAEFREEFLSLPREVLVTVMRVHQKQLPITRAGELTSSFLAVIDHHSDPDGNAHSGNAFVTNARFADARFFYETDRRRDLASRREELTHLQFQEKLGDYARKTDRIVALSAELHRLAGAETDLQQVTDAASLSKCDLMTEMVKEFTELQGQVGGIYAREEGRPDSVWQAIYDHYRPQSLDDPLPRGESGALVSLADKLDTLAGFFSIELEPTGSKDPFALRRAAQGVVQILLHEGDWRLDVPIDEAIERALDPFSESARDRSEVRIRLAGFIGERLRTILELEPFRFAYDEISAVMEAGWQRLHDAKRRLAALQAVREESNFLSILDSAKRIENITAHAEWTQIDETLLEHPTERRLAALVATVSDQIDELIASGHYRDALESFAAMATELESFFDDVLVMVDDPAVRNNRIALLRRCGSLAGRIADVTRIVVDRKDYRS